MVAGRDDDRTAVDARLRTARDPREMDDDLLEEAKTAGRLRQSVEVMLRGGHRVGVERSDTGQVRAQVAFDGLRRREPRGGQVGHSSGRTLERDR